MHKEEFLIESWAKLELQEVDIYSSLDFGLVQVDCF